MLLKKRIEVRWQMMTALIAIYRRLESANEDGLLDTAIMPILIAGREDGEVTTSEVMIAVTSVCHYR